MKAQKSNEGSGFVDDSKIVDLYWARSECAISETRTKYEKMLSGISLSLLSSREDAEECVNDTYVAAWQQMPTDRPTYLGAYLSKIVRGLSIGKFRSRHRQKRGGFSELSLELCECIPDNYDIEAEYQNGALTELLNKFLAGQSDEKRKIFVRRYFYSDSIERIADKMDISTSKVKTTLHRMREELKKLLVEEGML